MVTATGQIHHKKYKYLIWFLLIELCKIVLKTSSVVSRCWDLFAVSLVLWVCQTQGSVVKAEQNPSSKCSMAVDCGLRLVKELYQSISKLTTYPEHFMAKKFHLYSAAEALTNPTPFGPGVTPWPPWRNFNLALSSPMSTSRARCRRPSSAIFTKTWQSHPVHWWQIPCEKWQFPESRKCMTSWVKNTKSSATIF